MNYINNFYEIINKVFKTNTIDTNNTNDTTGIFESILSDNKKILEYENYNNIPKYLFITHENIDKMNNYKSKFIDIKLKNNNWDIYFFTNKDIEFFLEKHYPEYYYYYKLINDNYGAAKSDFWRYIIIYHYGGIYIDVSVEVYEKLDNIILEKTNLIITKHHTAGFFCKNTWGKDIYWNWFFASPPKNKILKKLIDTIILNINNHEQYLIRKSSNFFIPVSNYNTFILTGPLIFNKIVCDYLNEEDIYELKKNNIVYVKDKNEILYVIKYVLFNKGQTYHDTKEYIINI